MFALSRRLVMNYIVKRSRRLVLVQRFIAGWVGLLVLIMLLQLTQLNGLGPHYLSNKPAQGGTYVEGVVGEFSALNPLFADTLPGRTASRLMFSGLAKRDYKGAIQPDLASGWSVNADGSEYTVSLRSGLSWQDGAPLSAEDVVFTIKSIQNSATKSPLADDWQGVEVKALDALNVSFSLSAPFAPFLQLLTVGIIPKHILGSVPPAQLRVHRFNQTPVGSGPYRFEQFLVNRSEIRLGAYEGFYRGAPKISTFVVKAFSDYGQLAAALGRREISGAGGFNNEESAKFGELGKDYVAWPGARESFLFMNTARPILSNPRVRQAITRATNTHALALSYRPAVRATDSALLAEQLNGEAADKQLGFNPSLSRQLLERAGWKSNSGDPRSKKNQVLKLVLVTPQTDIYPIVASQLQQQLQRVGVSVEIKTVSADEFQSRYVNPRQYDLLLSAIPLGADPDVYAYWHSSQANSSGSNFSNYSSAAADNLLEAGRTRVDPRVRLAKYHAFLKVWRQDSPAVALYQHNYFYVAKGIELPGVKWLPEPLDRFAEVNEWHVRTEPKLKRLVE